MHDNYIYGKDNSYDYGMRFYDPRLGRFMSVDPLAHKYPHYSTYIYAGDKPIWAIDLDGLEDLDIQMWNDMDRKYYGTTYVKPITAREIERMGAIVSEKGEYFMILSTSVTVASDGASAEVTGPMFAVGAAANLVGSIIQGGAELAQRKWWEAGITFGFSYAGDALEKRMVRDLALKTELKKEVGTVVLDQGLNNLQTTVTNKVEAHTNNAQDSKPGNASQEKGTTNPAPIQNSGASKGITPTDPNAQAKPTTPKPDAVKPSTSTQPNTSTQPSVPSSYGLAPEIPGKTGDSGGTSSY